MIKQNIWIDTDYCVRVGQVGFLVGRSHLIRPLWETIKLHEEPARTNQSFEPRLKGWCGTTNDVCVTAMGMAKVVKLSKSGARALVTKIVGDELRAALEEAGYPELMPEQVA